MEGAMDVEPFSHASGRRLWGDPTPDDVPMGKPEKWPSSPPRALGLGERPLSNPSSPSACKTSPLLPPSAYTYDEGIKAWRHKTLRPIAPAMEEAAGTVSRLAARLKEGAAVVAQQEREKAELAAEAQSHEHHHIQREAALEARAKAAEGQLADTHVALQAAQRAQREAAATAAEFREKIVTLREERDSALEKLDQASRMLREACVRAEATAAERDAALKEARAGNEAALEAAARVREAEALHNAVRHREVALAKAQSAVDAEAAKVRQAALECQRRETEAQLLEREIERKKRALEDKTASLAAQSAAVSGREAAVRALTARAERERAELQDIRQELRKESEDLEHKADLVRQAEAAVKDAKEAIAQERAQLEREKHDAAVECGQAAARAALARREAEDASRKATDAEAAAQAAYDRTLSEERRLREAQAQCAEEQRRAHELQAESARLADDVTLRRAESAAIEADIRDRRAALDAALRAVDAERREAQAQKEELVKERLALEERIKALAQHERQAMEAAEEARREQVLLSCARRDSARAVADMQRRHLEAAVQLEGPGPGGAVHAQYEAVREEQVLRLATQTHKEHDQKKETEAVNPGLASPRCRSEQPAPLLRDTCRAVASEVQGRLERWKEQLQSSGAYFENRPPVAEPSLATISGTPTAINNDRSPSARPSSASWPGIFTFPREG